jgi:hypothetical protein
MVKKITELSTYLYSKYANNDISEKYKTQIKQIVKEEIKLIKCLLHKKRK